MIKFKYEPPTEPPKIVGFTFKYSEDAKPLLAAVWGRDSLVQITLSKHAGYSVRISPEQAQDFANALLAMVERGKPDNTFL